MRLRNMLQGNLQKNSGIRLQDVLTLEKSYSESSKFFKAVGDGYISQLNSIADNVKTTNQAPSMITQGKIDVMSQQILILAGAHKQGNECMGELKKMCLTKGMTRDNQEIYGVLSSTLEALDYLTQDVSKQLETYLNN